MIYAEQVDSNGTILSKGVYMTHIEACQADKEARAKGEHLTGALLVNVAMNRFREDRCIYCGAPVGKRHNHCVDGVVSPTMYKSPVPAHAVARGVARLLENTMQCNCDLDNWQPEPTTGHSHVCRIHQMAMTAKHDRSSSLQALFQAVNAALDSKGGEL